MVVGDERGGEGSIGFFSETDLRLLRLPLSRFGNPSSSLGSDPFPPSPTHPPHMARPPAPSTDAPLARYAVR